MNKIVNNKLKVIDLFAGVGGLSYGFSHDNHFDIVAANEILPNMATAYKLNHPEVTVYCKDVKHFGILDLQKDFNINQSEIDIIVGGPPCQAYSTVGKRLIEDPRAQLFKEYYRVIKEVKPKVFLYENVKGLLSMQGGALIKTIVELFKELGYNVSYKILNAADYGAPQIRERVIIVGTSLKQPFHFPRPTHTNSISLFSDLKPFLTLSEAIGDLPFIKSGEECFTYSSKPQNEFQSWMRANNSTVLLEHNAPNNNSKLVELMKSLPDGGTPLDLPQELRPSSGFANTYSRLWWNKPSTTITRNLSTPSSSRCIHPIAPRPLTTREGARLQCFPDNYIFYGSRSDKNLQVGNAVNVFLAIALKDAIKNHFFENKISKQNSTQNKSELSIESHYL